MLNKNDPLIGVVQEVMNRNHAEREAVKVVNEKFGIQDRKVLPHERQHEWEEVYQTVLSEGLESLAPPLNKTTKRDILVGRGVLKKHPTKPGKHVLAKEEALDEDELNDKGKGSKQKAKTYKHKNSGKEISSVSHPGKEWDLVNEGSDVTSPSRMGINKPDYAPPGTTPDYAKSKEQTVNRADKTSLPPGTVAKSIKEAVYSGGMKPTNTRSTNYGGGNVNQAGSGSGASGIGSQVMGQSAYSSGATGPRGPAGGNGAVTRPATAPAPTGPRGPAGGNGAVTRPATAPAPARTNPGTDKLNAATSAAAKQNPTVSGTRFGGASTYQAKTAAAAKPMGAGAAGQQVGAPAAKPMGAGAAGQQVGAPKVPIPRVKPAVAATAKPVAKKVTPVRKAGAPAGATKPAKKLTPLQQQMKRSRYNRDGGNVGPGSS